MNLTSIILNGLELFNSLDYCFSLSGFNDFDKNVVTSDLYSDGESFGRSKIKPKTLVLSGKIQSYSMVKILALNQVLAADGLKQLLITDDELGQLSAMVEITSRGANANTAFSRINPRMVAIQLELPDPAFYSVLAQTISLGSVSNASLVPPLVPPLVLGGLTGGTGTLTNYGNLNAYPVITVVGNCNTITITNNTTGQTLSLNISLNDGDTLVIDCRPASRSITLNGSTNEIGVKSGSWIYCVPGANSFTFTRNSQEVKQHCSIALNSRYF